MLNQFHFVLCVNKLFAVNPFMLKGGIASPVASMDFANLFVYLLLLSYVKQCFLSRNFLFSAKLQKK